MNILFYYPDKERAISLSSLMIAFQQQGHHVTLFTHAKKGDLHQDVEDYGVKIHTYTIKKSNPLLFYFRHVLQLISFIKNNNIEIVYSHIQRANIIAVFVQYFVNARIILCRHHSDCAFVDKNYNERLFDRIINALGKEFIVPSQKVLDQMIKVEGVSNKKIHLIRYAYDFTKYKQSEEVAVNQIRLNYPTTFLIIKVARLIKEKRHIKLLQALNNLKSLGVDFQLLLLGDGIEKDFLQTFVNQNNLQENIHFLGYRNDVMNFISAADLVVHVSESEASSSLAKEAGLMRKPILLCENVGDFDEYIVNNQNGILIRKEFTENELSEKLLAFADKRIEFQSLGEELRKTVIEKFSIESLIFEYKDLNA